MPAHRTISLKGRSTVAFWSERCATHLNASAPKKRWPTSATSFTPCSIICQTAFISKIRKAALLLDDSPADPDKAAFRIYFKDQESRFIRISRAVIEQFKLKHPREA